MLLNLDQLQRQLDKDEFQEDGSMIAFWVVNNQFQKFIDSKFTLDYDSQMTDTYFVEYTGIEVQHFRDTLLQHLDSTVQDDSSRSGNDTDADDADIRPIYDEEPMAEIFTRDRFSPNKTSAVYEKTSSRSDLRWKPTGRIFKTVGLRWIPTGKLFNSCTTKVDSEPPHGSNVDIPNIYVCKQALDLSAGTSLNGQKQQRIDLSAGALYNVKQENLRVWLLKKMISHKPVPEFTTVQASILNVERPETVTTSNELDLLFGPLFDEYFNGENQVVLKSSAVTTTDASNKRQQQPDSPSSTSTLAIAVTANGNFDL
ncbi:hypothetical protein Tco_0974427 [Tanacetum coccineum]|uniref:Uncharacterized protein n=1 Tax=Tanacetum coccineum TaxID=301880 RepID=A0ABQ5EBJ6_9ASTR